MAPADTDTNTGVEPMAVDAPDSESPSAATEPQPPSKVADADDPVPIETQTDRYLVLVEFVYRHLNFQMAELKSILETYGIRLGTRRDDKDDDETDCRLVALPVPDSPTCSDSPTVVAQNRAFCILSFPSNTAGRWSGLLQSPEDQRRNSRFEPKISATTTAVSSDSLSIADVLYKCTLVKSVVELWGYSSVSLEDCADRTLKWLHDGNNDNNHHHQEESFQKKHVWPSICRDTERPWKFTIHTLGMKVQRQEQDAMRQTFRSTLDCIEGPVRLKDPASQEFLLIREIELDGKGSPLWKAETADETTAITITTTTTTTTNDATAIAMTIAEGSGNNSSNDTTTTTTTNNDEQNPTTPSGGKNNQTPQKGKKKRILYRRHCPLLWPRPGRTQAQQRRIPRHRLLLAQVPAVPRTDQHGRRALLCHDQSGQGDHRHHGL
mmetsp:Transcript_31407/g.73914  ORF Transcript_31407/g.73914 Transcript_31407/m.73914 type:complete len:437 (+) Transcript_31407:188-1498(+)